MLKVLYVMAHSRSGSTILDLCLGQHPEICSTGELCNFYRYGHIEKQYCACGERVVECPFWSEVTSSLVTRVGSDDFVDQRRTQQIFERRRYLPLRNCCGSLFRRSQDRYEGQLLALYQSIADISGRQIIVDSSKDPFRAYWIRQLAQRGALDAYFLFLVRDGRGVVWSLKKRYPRDPSSGVQMEFKGYSTWRATMAWLTNNLECEWLFARCDPSSSMRLKYEEICVDPENAVDKIAAIVGFDALPVKNCLRYGEGLDPLHLVSGNRMRMAGTLQFRPDYEWRERLTELDRRVFWTIAGWYANNLGYAKLA